MNLIVKALQPKQGNEFADFFSNLNFEHEPHWSSCYCRFYHTDCTSEQWQNRSAAENRREALEKIDRGEMKGYLAYDGDKIIGWLNANDARSYIRLKEKMEPVIQDKKAGCSICYVIDPDYRRKGVATALLEYAVKDFKRQGYDGMLAIPLEKPMDQNNNPATLYRGAVSMYQKQGYKELFRDGPVRVLWLDL